MTAPYKGLGSSQGSFFLATHESLMRMELHMHKII